MKNYVRETILFLLSFFVFLISLNNNPQIAQLAFNADNLYPAVLYQDLVIDGNSLRGWSLTPSPFVFPDILVYFLIRSIVHNWTLSLYSAYAFQALLLLFSLLLFANSNRKTKDEKTSTIRIILLVYSSFLILFSVHSYFFPVLGFASHGGALAFSLLCWSFWERLSEQSERKRFFLWVLFGILQILLIVSDPLFLLFFNGPLLLLCLKKLTANSNRFALRDLIFQLLCAFGGLYVYRTLTKSDFVFIPTGYYSGTPSWNWIAPIAITIKSQFQTSPFSFGFVLISYPILVFVRFFFKSKLENENVPDPESSSRIESKSEIKADSESEDRFLFLIVSVFVSTFGIAVIGSASGISQKEGIHLRYLLPLLFFWIVILIEILSKSAINYKKRIFSFLNVEFLLLFLFVSFQGNLKPVLYRDNLAHCMDRISSEHGNGYPGRGISDFWTSRRIRIFSETDLRVDNYMPDLHPEYWQNSWSWFTKIPETEYSFVILPGLNSNLLKREFGDFDFIYTCENHKILIWNSDSAERFSSFRKKKIEEIKLWHKLTGRKFSSPE